VNPAPPTGGRKEDLPELAVSLAKLADALLDRGLDLTDAVKIFETRYLQAAVERHEGNISRASAVLGIHRNTLRSKLQRNGHRARPRRR
jgi:DNA-binding NtrC family response regulator